MKVQKRRCYIPRNLRVRRAGSGGNCQGAARNIRKRNIRLRTVRIQR